MSNRAHFTVCLVMATFAVAAWAIIIIGHDGIVTLWEHHPALLWGGGATLLAAFFHDIYLD